MPELAEVAFYCSRWKPGWGNRILQVRMNGQTRCFRSVDSSRLSERLLENRVIRSHTHGKRMLFELDQRLWLGIHLGMTGSLLIRPSEADLESMTTWLWRRVWGGWFSTIRDNSEKSKVSKAMHCPNFGNAYLLSQTRINSISGISGCLLRGEQSSL